MRSRSGGSEGGKWTKHITHLSSGDDNIFVPILNAYRSIGIHDSQVAAMKITTPESFLGGRFVCEILWDPKDHIR